MEIKYITGHTRILGAPEGWNPETSGECLGLPIRDDMNGDMPVMTSRWQPTESEIAAIAGGAAIFLDVVGRGHPPVMLHVGDPRPRPTQG